MGILEIIISLGPSVMMPILFTVIGIGVGLTFTKSLKAGLYMGISFIGLGLVTTLLIDQLEPIIGLMSSDLKGSMTFLDVGWPLLSEVSLSIPLGLSMILISILVNYLLFNMKLTNTINIDIWNYWHYSFVAYLVLILTDNIILAFEISILNIVLTTYLSDKYIEHMHRFYDNSEGLNFVFPVSVLYIPFAKILNYVMDRIPVINKIKFDSKKLNSKIGDLSNPAVIGLLVGITLSMLSGLDLVDSLKLSMNISAVMLLVPKITQILSDGLKVIADHIRNGIEGKTLNRNILLGVSPSLLVGNKANLITTIICIPVVLILSIIIPSNKFIPIASLTAIMYILPHAIMIFEGNIFRTTIFGIVFTLIGNYIIMPIGPQLLKAAKGFHNFSSEITGIGTLDYAGHPFVYFTYKFIDLFNYKFLMFIVLIMIVITLVQMKKQTKIS